MWLDEDLSTLRTAIDSDLSASQASRMLDGKFSRSACLSKAKRLGLHFNSTPAAPPKPQPEKVLSPFGISPLTGLLRTVRQIPPSNDSIPPDRREEQAARDAENPGVPYMQLTFADQRCRWPLNDHTNIETHCVCGQFAEDGRWCEQHRAIVYKPMRARDPHHVGKARP